MCHALGLTLHECMDRMTEREMRVHLAWLEMQWNRPSRTDWYLMQVAAEVRRGIVKRPAAVRTEQLKITFTTPKQSASRAKVTPQEQAEHSRRMWLAAAGIEPKQ